MVPATSVFLLGGMLDEEPGEDLEDELEVDEEEISACAPYLARQMSCLGRVTPGWLKLWARISVRETGEGVCVQGTHMQVKQRTNKNQEQEQVSKNKRETSRTRTKNQPQAQTHRIYPASGPLRKVKPLLQL